MSSDMILGLLIAYGHILFWLEIFGVFSKKGWTKRILMFLFASIAFFLTLYAWFMTDVDHTPLIYTFPLAVGYFLLAVIGLFNYRKALKKGKMIHLKAGEWKIVDDISWLVPTYIGKPSLKRCIKSKEGIIACIQLTADPETSGFSALVIPDKEGVYYPVDYWYEQAIPVTKRIIQVLTVISALVLPAAVAWAAAESGGIPIRDDIPQYDLSAGLVGFVIFGFNTLLAWESEHKFIKIWKKVSLLLALIILLEILFIILTWAL